MLTTFAHDRSPPVNPHNTKEHHMSFLDNLIVAFTTAIGPFVHMGSAASSNLALMLGWI